MLVLSRLVYESIVITVPPSSTPTKIEVIVTDLRGLKVRLGIDAPKNVPVHRKEVQQAIDNHPETRRT